MSASSRYRRLRALKRRFDAALVAFAWYAGWLGVSALAACLLVAALPNALWDGLFGLQAESWPLYAMISLMVAGLLGFSLVNQGQDRIKRLAGPVMSALLFAILPLGCLAVSLWPEWADGGIRLFARWYPPAITVLCAAVFLAWKARPRKHVYLERGLGYALLLAPYALLFATMELGLHMNWLDDSRRETITQLGSAAIVLQVVLAFFIGGTE